MKKLFSLYLYVFLLVAILSIPIQAWGGEVYSNEDLMAWVAGRHLTLTWDPMPYATGYTIQAGFPPNENSENVENSCDGFESVVSLDVGESTTFSVSNAGEGTYCVQVVALGPTNPDIVFPWESDELEIEVRGDAGDAGEDGEYSGVWNVNMTLQPMDGDSCQGFDLLNPDFPIMIDQRGQSLLVVLGDFNFRGALRQDNSFLLAGAQPWRYGDCHHTFRYYMAGTLVDNEISGTGEFHDTWFCRESGGGNANGQDQDNGSSVERIRPDNPGGGRPDNPGGGPPDHPGGGDNGSRINRCVLTFTINGTRNLQQ